MAEPVSAGLVERSGCGEPEWNVTDGPEFTMRALDEWAYQHRVQQAFRWTKADSKARTGRMPRPLFTSADEA